MFGHVERISVEWFANRVYQFEVEGGRHEGRSCTTVLDENEKACSAKTLQFREAKVYDLVRDQIRDLVSCINDDMNQ